MSLKKLMVGSRDSALAMWQTNWVVKKLGELYPELEIRILPVKTQGDKILDVALAKIGDKGLFTKELEAALLEGSIDMAVHSMKDLPTAVPDGLTIGAVGPRAEPCDVLISNHVCNLTDLPQHAVVGTSSLRRKAQLLQFRPDLEITDLRGNLNTRLAKLDRGNYQAIVLARAGIERLDLLDRVTECIPYDICLPAVGQGSIGVEIRAGDRETGQIVDRINDRDAADAIRGERSLMRELEGGCQIPIGALGRINGAELRLDGMVASLDGREIIRYTVQGPRQEGDRLGRELALRLKSLGGEAILKEVRRRIDADGQGG